MTYCQHLKHAHTLSYIFMKGTFKCFIHGLFPNIYTTCAEDSIKLANKKFETHPSGLLDSRKKWKKSR